MTEVEIYGTGRSAMLPSTWDEMTPEQVRRTFRLYDSCVRGGLSPLEFSVKELYMLLGLRPKQRDAEGMGAENIWTLCDRCLGFLFDGDRASLSFSSVSNPIPVIRSGLFRLIGPSDLLSDLTFGEFRHASAAFSEFWASGKEEDLNEALAFLYRRQSRTPNRAGRKVRPVSDGDMEADRRLAARMKPWQKTLAMMWYSSCVKYLSSGTVRIDGETVEMGRLFREGVGDGPSFGWVDLLVELAREGGLGTMEEVDSQPLFTVLQVMWHNFKENKRNERDRKAHKA